MAKYYVYVIRCADNSLYTGYTNDVEKRFRMHQEGKGAKYTRGRGPLRLEYVECYDTKTAAMKAEYAFKRRSKREKEQYLMERKQQNVATKKL